MEDLVSQTSLICSGIVLVAILITIGLVRSLANSFIIIIFGGAILSPIGFEYFLEYFNNVNYLQMDKKLLYLYACVMGIFATIITIPLWGISSIMSFEDKSHAKKIQKIQDNLKDLKNKSEWVNLILHNTSFT